jgi:hypothetical protein
MYLDRLEYDCGRGYWLVKWCRRTRLLRTVSDPFSMAASTVLSDFYAGNASQMSVRQNSVLSVNISRFYTNPKHYFARFFQLQKNGDVEESGNTNQTNMSGDAAQDRFAIFHVQRLRLNISCYA